MTRASHILLANTGPESLGKAKELITQLRGGASFEALAKAHSIDAGSATKGGDLGFFGPGKMVQSFEDELQRLVKPGDVSEPVESQFGYHIIRLEERKAKSIKPYDEVKRSLMEEARISILNEKRVQKVQSFNSGIVFDRAVIDGMSKPSVP